MLRKLLIRNYAIIKEIELSPEQGLTVITGETGAGKSILLGALGLILGERADTKYILPGAEKCIVEAEFEIDGYKLEAVLLEQDIEISDVLILRREVSAQGKSRAFVNDTPVALPILKAITEQLVDVHRQFDTRDIHEQNYQLATLDALANQSAACQNYKTQWRQWQSQKSHLQKLTESQAAGMRAYDFNQFQLDEIAQCQWEPGAYAQLESEFKSLMHADELELHIQNIQQQCEGGDTNLLESLRSIQKQLAPIRHLIPDLELVSQQFSEISNQVTEQLRLLQGIQRQIQRDPQRLQIVNDKLDQCNQLLKKHRCNTETELFAVRDQLAQSVATYSSLHEEIEKSKAQCEVLEFACREGGEQLHQGRMKVIPEFQAKINTQLKLLGMEHASLRIQMEKKEQLGETGMDDVQFLLTPNKGSIERPIRDIASGGEMSRLALIIKSQVAHAMVLPTLIFDEIDSGVSGEVAQRMSQVLRQLAEEHQVLVITHSAQIAAGAHAHYFVSKQIKNAHTIASMQKLEEEDRIHVIAVMLSTNPPTPGALINAKELIEQFQIPKSKKKMKI